jgi:hypothetical protein
MRSNGGAKREYQGCRICRLEKAGIEETVPFWDEEHSHFGINDSVMHLIISYIYGA